MAHLKDMEELLSTIDAGATREYMREAMNCYMTSAYRGCIVLSCIALFDDLLSKVEQLGKVNKDAKEIWEACVKKKADQEIFESFLGDKLASKALIEKLDAEFLEVVRTLRNKSAHPSGHTPSAEEARYIYSECISRFLSKPVLSTTHLIDQLIARLGNSNFFPTTSSEDVRDIVASEIGPIHSAAAPALVDKLVAAMASGPSIVAKNAVLFFAGLIQQVGSAYQEPIKKKVVFAKAEDAKFSSLVLTMVSLNGTSLARAPIHIKSRVQKLIINELESPSATITENSLAHPTRVVASLLSALPDSELYPDFEPALQKMFEKRPYSPHLIAQVKPSSKALDLMFGELRKKAGSSDFNIANNFAAGVTQVDQEVSAILTDEMAFTLVVGVVRAAEIGAFGAQDLRNSRFEGAPKLKAKAIAFTSSNATIADHIVNSAHLDVSNVADFIKAYL